MAKAERIKLRDRTLENDIRYKAPLSYRYLRIIAWACLVIAQIAVLVRISIRLNPSTANQLNWVIQVGNFVANVPLPLFLLANFAVLIQKKESFRDMLIFYGGIALILFVVGNLIVIHYGIGFIKTLIPGVPFMSWSLLWGGILFNLGHTGYVFNIFIDLFLCSLMMFFLDYKPKKSFKGKYLKIFRSFVAFPIIYEVACIIIKFLVAKGTMDIPFFCFFLLPSKPPMLFIAFIVLILILKIEEIKATKRKNDPEFIKQHRKTNAHSFRFSLIISLVFTLSVIVDVIISLILTAVLANSISAEPADEAINAALRIVNLVGFGGSVALSIIVPITLLFSYTKRHKNTRIDSFIPLIGIALIAIVYIEGIYQILVRYLQKIIDIIQKYLAK